MAWPRVNNYVGVAKVHKKLASSIAKLRVSTFDNIHSVALVLRLTIVVKLRTLKRFKHESKQPFKPLIIRRVKIA